MKLAEITDIDNLETGSFYAAVRKENKEERPLEYLKVIRVSKETKSGELVVTQGGNRAFSNMRWFGPFPASLKQIETMADISQI